MRVIEMVLRALRHRPPPRPDAPRCEGRVLHLVGDNPGGEVVRVAAMGRTTVRVMDRRAFERACAAAMGGTDR